VNPDVIVVGAGIVGCAVSDALLRQGCRVRVFDPRGVGLGATQASAGMLTPFSEGRHHATLEALGARSLRMYDSFIEQTVDKSQPPDWYARTGSLEIAVNEVEREELQARAADHAARGIESSFIPGADVPRAEPEATARAIAALLVPSHGHVNARELTAALWASCERQGAHLDVAPVRRIAASGKDVTVTTDSSSFTAAHVVLATGGWTGQLAIEGVSALPVRPIKGQLLRLAGGVPKLARIAWGSRCYTVPFADGSLLVGATLEDVGFDERPTVAGVRELMDAVCELLPGVARAGFSDVRVGLRPGSPDALPALGRSSRIRGLIYAVGHYRNGVLLAPLTAELVSQLVAGPGGDGDPALAALSPQRFGEL
jgi:glycine oxidase